VEPLLAGGGHRGPRLADEGVDQVEEPVDAADHPTEVALAVAAEQAGFEVAARRLLAQLGEAGDPLAVALQLGAVGGVEGTAGLGARGEVRHGGSFTARRRTLRRW
jgi:hypothetical protein